MKNKRPAIILATVAVLLLIPFIAGFDWTASDYIIMGILLSITGLSVELVLSIVKNTAFRFLLLGFVLLTFFLVWAELAVGIFGTPFAGS